MSTGNFVVRLFSAIWRGANGLRKVMHLLLLLVIFMVFIGVMSGEAPPILPERAALVIQPAGALVEQLDGDPYDRALAELMDEAQPQTLMRDVLDALEHATEDDRIAAVHLELSALGGAGLDKLRRVADAIEAFKQSGKPVIASADYYTQNAYYLAAHADEIYLNPNGFIFIQGYGSYRTYYRDAIDLLRIDWNLFRLGTHKTAFESYERMDMSPEDRESRNRLLNQLWGAYQEAVVTARGLPDNAIGDYADNLVMQAQEAGGDPAIAARDRGLVDDLLGRAELREVLIAQVGPDKDDESTYSGVSMRGYLSQMALRGGSKSASQNVAVVVASGSILDGDQPPGSIGGDSTAALLERALDDESVKAVVLRVDSGGGSAFASDVIADEVLALREAGKPVVASMSSVAASGGYWISMHADQIFASPTTITGSIGVLGMFPTFQRSLAAIGVATDGVGTTPWSGQLRPDREMSEDARRLIQMFIKDTYNDFVNGVAEGRDLEPDYVDQIGQGQVWSGEEAFANGLVDVLGDLDEAIVAAAELAGMEEGDYGQVLIERRMSPTEQLILDLLTSITMVGIDPAAIARKPAPIEVFANYLHALLAEVAQFNDPKGIYSHCFCEIQ
ncbi:MAG: signal peptide peptidase SppA [Gammaproteobacteria bacterium]|nr:signal peptide peptidase SppA [Gammaproteobacteria bacterium]